MSGRMEGTFYDGKKKIKLQGDCKIVPQRQASIFGHNQLTIEFLKPPKGLGMLLDIDSHYLEKKMSAKIHLAPRPYVKFEIKKREN
jgi:hypothetical protein